MALAAIRFVGLCEPALKVAVSVRRRRLLASLGRFALFLARRRSPSIRKNHRDAHALRTSAIAPNYSDQTHVSVLQRRPLTEPRGALQAPSRHGPIWGSAWSICRRLDPEVSRVSPLVRRAINAAERPRSPRTAIPVRNPLAHMLV